MAFGLVFCGEEEEAEEEAEEEVEEAALENGRTYGFWRLAGIIDAPPDWNPKLDSDLLQIWFGEDYPEERLQQINWPLYTGPHCVSPAGGTWTFKTRGIYGDPWGLYEYFVPKGYWWSHPEWSPPLINRTWVRGYVKEGEEYVLADEDISKSPKNPPGFVEPEWKYDHYGGDYGYLWWWDPVYLNLR
ncbi:hypothetical protein KAU45_02365 [bacterium]|nr:hypothetical protein [bacterium]